MEWQITLLVIMGGVVILLLTGLPVAFCFLIVNMVWAYVYLGGIQGWAQLSYSIISAIGTFAIFPIAMFILMGEFMFLSGIAPRMMDALDQWMGRITGRLALLGVLGGVIFAVLSGSGTAGVAMLGSVLSPDMENRGYKKSMSLGPIAASGGLAVMIPPTAMGIFLAVVAKVSIPILLIAIIIPGLIMGVFYAAYIILRCWLDPSIAPRYKMESTALTIKLKSFALYVMPLSLIVFCVIGMVLMGIATPSESACLGTLAAFLLGLLYRKSGWQVVRKSVMAATRITIMLLLILGSAVALSQILSLSGASRGLAEFAAKLEVQPVFIVIGMQIVILIMGCFMEIYSIIMVTMPIFMPLVTYWGIDPIWFVVITLINLETAMITPPFGFSLFVMKSVAPRGTTIADIYKACYPFVLLNIMVIGLIIIFPQIVSWLPGFMAI